MGQSKQVSIIHSGVNDRSRFHKDKSRTQRCEKSKGDTHVAFDGFAGFAFEFLGCSIDDALAAMRISTRVLSS